MILLAAYIILISVIFFYKISVFEKLIYSYIVSDFFRHVNSGFGVELYSLSNFTFYDFLGFMSVGIIIYELLKLKIITDRKIKKHIYLIFGILTYLFVLIVFSYHLYGTEGIQANRINIYAILYLGALSFTIRPDLNYGLIIERSLKLLAVSAIIIYVLRFTGILNYFVGAYGESDDYSLYRFLINTQVIYLASYYIFASYLRQKGKKLSFSETLLMYISAILVITSTQRMITILFVGYLAFEIIFYSRKRFAILTLIVGSSVLLFAPQDFLIKLKYAFYDVYEFEGSNAKGKLYDIPASVIALYNDGSLLLGRYFSSDWLNRSFLDFVSLNTRPPHNLFLTYLFHGGILFTIPLLLLWVKILWDLFKSSTFLKRTDSSRSILSSVCFMLLTFLFLFNMSSGASFINSVYICFSLGVLSLKK